MKLIVFDLDGTLVDTMGIYEEKASELMEKFYRVDRDWARRMYRRTAGLPFLHQLSEIFPDRSYMNFQVAKIFENWKKVALVGVKVSPEIREFLHELKERYILALSTNNTLEAAKKMVEGCPFDYILAWDWKSFTKGEPHFRWLEEKTGMPRSEFLFVGDSERDGEIAERSGVEFLKTDVKSIRNDTIKRLDYSTAP